MYSRQSFKLITHLNLVPKSRISGVLSPRPCTHQWCIGPEKTVPCICLSDVFSQLLLSSRLYWLALPFTKFISKYIALCLISVRGTEMSRLEDRLRAVVLHRMFFAVTSVSKSSCLLSPSLPFTQLLYSVSSHVWMWDQTNVILVFACVLLDTAVDLRTGELCSYN